VKIIRLDDFVKNESLKRIDFIKIDTEGYEVNVVNGAKETIKNYLPILSISCHSEKNKNFLIELIKEIHPSYNFFVSNKDKNDIVFIPEKN
jgi:hypothetical protein